EVACHTADELIQTGRAPAPTLMKIDVEGWELHVLNGARQLLGSARLKAIVIEAASDPTGTLIDARVADLLRDHGYRTTRIHRPEGQVRGVENYLAVLA